MAMSCVYGQFLQLANQTAQYPIICYVKKDSHGTMMQLYDNSIYSLPSI